MSEMAVPDIRNPCLGLPFAGQEISFVPFGKTLSLSKTGALQSWSQRALVDPFSQLPPFPEPLVLHRTL